VLKKPFSARGFENCGGTAGGSILRQLASTTREKLGRTGGVAAISAIAPAEVVKMSSFADRGMALGAIDVDAVTVSGGRHLVSKHINSVLHSSAYFTSMLQ
jgi:hypothetical protein